MARVIIAPRIASAGFWTRLGMALLTGRRHLA